LLLLWTYCRANTIVAKAGAGGLEGVGVRDDASWRRRMIRKSVQRFSKRSYSNKELKREDDSPKPHRPLALAAHQEEQVLAAHRYLMWVTGNRFHEGLRCPEIGE
jgi:hypothetical protein